MELRVTRGQDGDLFAVAVRLERLLEIRPGKSAVGLPRSYKCSAPSSMGLLRHPFKGLGTIAVAADDHDANRYLMGRFRRFGREPRAPLAIGGKWQRHGKEALEPLRPLRFTDGAAVR